MKIKKIYLQNFKGIYEKKIVDFESQVSLLIGPNGFGKTTIFDVIELCVTGKIFRTSQKDDVTKHQKDYIKPFYQNTVNQEVIVKVWLTKNEDGVEKDLIIVKHLPRDNDGRSKNSGRRNKPTDFNLLDTYKEKPKNFDDNELKIDEATPIEQKHINQFFGFKETDFDIKDIYNLFNYLQQEEITFFLKKSENDRKNSLSFLFQTKNQEEEYNKLKMWERNLKVIHNEISKKINEIKAINLEESVEYKALFPYKEIEFDKKDLFEDMNLIVTESKFKHYHKELSNIISFLENFSLVDYENKIMFKELEKNETDYEFLDYFTLSNLIRDKYSFIKEKFDLLENDQLLTGYILKDCIKNYKKYKETNLKIDNFEKFLKFNKLDDQLNELLTYDFNKMPFELEKLRDLCDLQKQVKESTKSLDLSIKNIIESRNHLNKHFKEVSKKLANHICPYCGENWENSEKLLLSFKEREQTFRELYSNQLSKLTYIERRLEEEYVIPTKKYIDKYLEENKRTDEKIINKLKELDEAKIDYKKYDDLNLDVSIQWSFPKDFEALKLDLTKLKNRIYEKLPVSKNVYSKMKKFYGVSFESNMNKFQKNIPMSYLNSYIISAESEKVTTDKQNQLSKKLADFINQYKNNFKYDHDKVKDEHQIYERYFEKNKKLIKSIDIQDFKQKKNYINYIYSMKKHHILKMYEDRESKLRNIIGKISENKTFYNEKIKEHKKLMVENIKVPFYIYTAKILQNYQQGMGVFLSTKDNDSIRFLTDATSNHDAIHHLSSGQLAVISLAFTLAINKTYNMSNNLKFLVIDDPIQEMDALNVHSFVELIRHEFLQDYQLIFSTHNDSNALYMKYKFEKIIKENISLISVQEMFFE